MIEVTGADDFVRLSKRLKEAGARDLQRELSKGITEAVKPLRKALQQSARQTLPAGGGLAERVARSRVSTRRTTSGQSYGIRVTAGGKKSQLANIDKGSVRHPVFGNRDAWVTQRVSGGWWTEPTQALGPDVRREVEKALQRVVNKIERGL